MAATRTRGYEGESPASGFGGFPSGSSLDTVNDKGIYQNSGYGYSGQEGKNFTHKHLHALLEELQEKLEQKGRLSKNNKVPTPAPQKPKKRERILTHGEWSLKPIPSLETSAMAGFVSEPLVPNAYLVKAA